MKTPALILCGIALLILPCLAVDLTSATIPATEPALPPSPSPSYIIDTPKVLSAAKFATLNTQLQQFERATTNQFVVAIYDRLPPNVALDDYCQRLANAWGVGQKEKNNGISFFVFVSDHKMRITLGTGLETTITNDVCKRILDNRVTPCLKAGDFDGGVQACVDALIEVASHPPTTASAPGNH